MRKYERIMKPDAKTQRPTAWLMWLADSDTAYYGNQALETGRSSVESRHIVSALA